MLKVNRRKFLKYITLTPLPLYFFKSPKIHCSTDINFSKTSNLLLSSSNLLPSQFANYSNNSTKEQILVKYGLNSKKHSFLYGPSKAHEILVIENGKLFLSIPKLEKRSFLFDSNLKIVKEYDALSGNEFYGHGVVLKNKTFLAVEGRSAKSAVGANGHNGIVVERNLITGKIINKFPTYGKNPHEIKFIDQGKKIVVANGGNNSCLSIIDSKSYELVDKILSPRYSWGIRHFVYSKQLNRFILALATLKYQTTNIPLVIVDRSNLKKLHRVKTLHSNDSSFQLLSLCLVGNIASSTCPESGAVLLWDVKKMQFLKKVKVPQVKGVVVSNDKKYFIASSALSSVGLVYINIKKLAIEKSLSFQHGQFVNGSHTLLI
ncbi:MAG: DUF1513 domain-containing protein [Bacteriovoracaceae bacterium]|nr:DUF1513 domain-containing protein [Bacteriovoracaceae bacterium]